MSTTYHAVSAPARPRQSTPEVSVKQVDDGYIVHIRPHAESTVYVVCGQQVQGMPCTAFTFSEDQQSLVYVEPVQEFSL